MKPLLKRLSKEYAAALSDYLAGGEDALRRAADQGRRAIAGGLGVVDLVSVHQDCLIRRLKSSPPRASYKPVIARSLSFLAESVSPYEIALRDSKETNLHLQDNLKVL